MKNISIWLDELEKKSFKRLDKDINVDVLVVGGGITGISTAYHLSTGDLKVCLVEKNKLMEGVTSRTTGKLTYLQENIYSKLVNYHGRNKTKLYLDSQKEAIKIVNSIIDSNKIECDLEKVSSYVFDYDDIESVEEEIKLLNDFGVDLKLSDVLPTGDNINTSYFIEDSYVFHPLKYLSSLVNICCDRGIKFYEDTKIISIEEDDNGYYICKSDDYNIRAKYVVIAVHYPYFLFPFLMPFKAYLEKSYIEAFKVDKNYRFSAINITKPIISTRYYENNKDIYQFYLTNSHNYCVKNDEEKNFEELFQCREEEADYVWSNKDIMTNDLLPYIGRINDSNIFIGTGYNTWGMTNGSLAGKIISDLILDRNNRYIELFSPNRKLNIGNFLKFPVSLWSSAYSFIKTKVSKNKEWYSDRVRFEKRNGKNVGIYIDDDKHEHIVYNLCPHMKCSLIFNEIEKTWDCPCHGSRFDIDGKSIEGPSNYDITYSEE